MEMRFDKILGRLIPKIKFNIRELEREKSKLEIHIICNDNVGWRKDRLEIVKKELNQLKDGA